jgi:beta-lactamase regulating signal transducer with metallopeptidase domain
MTALLAWAWQGTLVALVALVALRACRALDAATRHALWWGVLGSILALPWLPSAASLVQPAPPVPALALSAAALSPAPVRLPALPDWLVAVAVGAWLGTLLLGLLRVGRSLAFMTHLRRDATPLDPAREQRLGLWSTTPGRRRIALLVSPRVRTACALGLRRAAIVVPPSLLTADDETLDQVVMHERAHLERYDDVWRLAEALVDAVAGLHPGIRIALAQIDLEREAACDDRVVLRTGAAARYAASLAAAAACAVPSPHTGEPRLLPTAVAGRSALVLRVARLLDGTRRRRARLTPAVTLVGLVLLSGVAGAVSRLAPIVAFDATRAADAPAPVVTVTSTAFRHGPEAERTPPSPASKRRPFGAPRAARPPRPPDSDAPSTGAAAPSANEQDTAAAPPVQTAVTLPSRALTVPTEPPPAAVDGTRPSLEQGATSDTPWAAAADGGAAIGGAARRGGVATGTAARKAGTSIAGFFARAGRAVGSRF